MINGKFSILWIFDNYLFISYARSMDETTPQQPVGWRKQMTLRETIAWNAGKIFLGVTVLIVLFVLFNYFNIISVSNRYPKQFGWLPHTNSKLTTQLLPTPTPFTIACPVKLELCKTATVIREGDFVGLGFTLPKGTQIKAAFSGALSDQPKPTQRPTTEPLLYIRDDKGNEASYSYYGTEEKMTTFVKKGQLLGVIGDGSFPPYPPLTGKNFVITVKSGGKLIPLDPKQFSE